MIDVRHVMLVHGVNVETQRRNDSSTIIEERAQYVASRLGFDPLMGLLALDYAPHWHKFGYCDCGGDCDWKCGCAECEREAEEHRAGRFVRGLLRLAGHSFYESAFSYLMRKHYEASIADMAATAASPLLYGDGSDGDAYHYVVRYGGRDSEKE